MPTVLESFENLEIGLLEEFERELGIRLPDEYRDFLLAHNGGYPDPDVFTLPAGRREMVDRFLGISPGRSDDLRRYRIVYGGRLPSELLPVAHDSGGNLICLSILGEHRGMVFFWDHENEAKEGETPSYVNVDFVARGFAEFVKMLRPIESA